MQLVDTNVFIHVLIRPTGDTGRTEHDACTALIEEVDRGTRELATTEACLAEVFHVLTGKLKYGRPVEEGVTALRSIVGQRGIHVRRQAAYRHALDILDRYRSLSFEDALLAAHALETGMEILSYDKGFDRVHGVARIEPAPTR